MSYAALYFTSLVPISSSPTLVHVPSTSVLLFLKVYVRTRAFKRWSKRVHVLSEYIAKVTAARLLRELCIDVSPLSCILQNTPYKIIG